MSAPAKTGPAIRPGFVDLSHLDYLKLNVASCSRLKAMRRSLAFCRHEIDNFDDDTTNDSLALGRMIHTAILEPEFFQSRFYRLCGDDRRTVAVKADLERAVAAGKLAARPKDWDGAMAAREAVWKNRAARVLLEQADMIEQSAIGSLELPSGGAGLFKIRADFVVKGLRAVVDIKSAAEPDPSNFARSAANFGYEIQAGMYPAVLRALGLDVVNFVNLVVASTPPYEVYLYEIHADAQAWGHEEGLRLLEQYTEAERTGNWPGGAETVVNLDFPGWWYRERGIR